MDNISNVEAFEKATTKNNDSDSRMLCIDEKDSKIDDIDIGEKQVNLNSISTKQLFCSNDNTKNVNVVTSSIECKTYENENCKELNDKCIVTNESTVSLSNQSGDCVNLEVQMEDGCFSIMKTYDHNSSLHTSLVESCQTMDEVDNVDNINCNLKSGMISPNECNNLEQSTNNHSHNDSLESNSVIPHVSNCFSDNGMLNSTSHLSMFISHVNPVPNEFDMLKKNELPLFGQSNMPKLDVPYSDNSVVISNNNALPKAESIVSSNYSLAQLRSYGSDESLQEESFTNAQQYRDSKSKAYESDKDSDSESSSTSSSTSYFPSDSSDSESGEECETTNRVVHKPIKAKGELELDDLPPIEDLKISVPEEECLLIGKVYQIVDQLVVVQAMKDKPAYDLDTVLFLQGGQPLGKIFDVFGPVAEPLYCIRFNSNNQIKEKNIKLNQDVYSAPKTKYTKYVFLAQLMKLKGSDASWENDEEPPEIYLDYSDDEQEQNAKKKGSKNKKAVYKVDLDPDEPARKRHFAYEKKMNERNLQLTAVRTHQTTTKTNNSPWVAQKSSAGPSTSNSPRHQTMFRNDRQVFSGPPMFNTRVPPPNTPFSLAPRPNILKINHHMNALGNFINSSDQNFIIPSRSQAFSHPAGSSRLPNNIEIPRFHFPPPVPLHLRNEPKTSNNVKIPGRAVPPLQMQSPTTFRGNQDFNSSNPNFTQSFSNRESSWASSPPPRDFRNSPNNLTRSSPFWIQRPTTSNPNAQRPLSALNRPYMLPCQPPPHFIPTISSPPPRSNLPPNHVFPVNFNPHVPPPSPNPSNY